MLFFYQKVYVIQTLFETSLIESANFIGASLRQTSFVRSDARACAAGHALVKVRFAVIPDAWWASEIEG